MTDAQGKAFGAEMRRLRKEAGMTTAEFANYMGVTATYISNLELGNRKPSPQLAERVASAFSTNVADMLVPYEEREREARVNFGKALRNRRTEKGLTVQVVAGALGIPSEVYREYESGLCSIPEHKLNTLRILLSGNEKAEELKPVEVEELKPVEATEDQSLIPTAICDVILEHVTDLKVEVSVQKELWRFFSRLKLDAEEKRLFG